MHIDRAIWKLRQRRKKEQMLKIIRKTNRTSALLLLAAIVIFTVSMLQNSNIAEPTAKKSFGIHDTISDCANISDASITSLGIKSLELERYNAKTVHPYRNKLRTGSKLKISNKQKANNRTLLFLETETIASVRNAHRIERIGFFNEACALLLLTIIIYIFNADGKKRLVNIFVDKKYI